MNNEQLVQTGSTMGQRLRMAAVKVGEVIGFGGLLTAVAVEGSAALNLNTPVVQEAEAGTGIPGFVIDDAGCGAGEQPRLSVENNSGRNANLTLHDTTAQQSFAVFQGPGRTTYNFPRNSVIITTSDTAPGASDTETICPASVNSTTTTQPTTQAPATTLASTTSTTRNPNTSGSIPGGEQGQPISSGPTTTAQRAGNEAPSGQPGPDGPSGDNTTTATTRLAGPATPQAGRILALTGNEIGGKLAGGAALIAAGALLVILGRRRNQQTAA